MNTGGEAAEQIVRMSLEGFEVAAKITGAGAKNIAILLYSILKEEKKTKGKARLTSMLRSGKELKVFTVKSGDLKKFTQEAKKYGVLYCVLTDRKNKDPSGFISSERNTPMTGLWSVSAKIPMLSNSRASQSHRSRSIGSKAH